MQWELKSQMGQVQGLPRSDCARGLAAPPLQPGSLHPTLPPAPRPSPHARACPPPCSRGTGFCPAPRSPHPSSLELPLGLPPQRPHQPCGEHLGPRTRQRAHPSPRSVCACSPARALGSRDTLLPPRASPAPTPALTCPATRLRTPVSPLRRGGRTCSERARVPASLAPLQRTARRPRGAARIPG